MAGSQSGSGDVFFEERQWSSWQILLVGPAFFAGLGVVLSLASGPGAWTSSFPWLVGAGVALSLFIWSMNHLRKLQVRPNVVRLGRTAIAYGYIESVRFVDRAEAKEAFSSIEGRVPKLGFLMFAMTNKEWRRIHGNWWQPWMKHAILMQVKPGSPVITDRWLIGTRHPDELMAAIRAGMDRAPLPGAPADAAPSLA